MTILQNQVWEDLVARVSALLAGAEHGALSFLLATLVALAGWGIAQLAAMLVRTLLRVLRFNENVRRLFGATTLAHEPAGLAAWAAYWVILVVSLVLAVDTLGFSLGASVSSRIGEVLPRIVVAAVLLMIGLLVAMMLGSITHRFFETAGIRGARVRGQVVTAVLTAFAVLLALEQLGFAAQFVMAIGLIAFGALGLALGLAFGLGCRDLARDFVVEYLRSLEEQGPQRPA